nr:hypothetical protein TetV2_00226 [Oceanusvirus sp.]
MTQPNPHPKYIETRKGLVMLPESTKGAPHRYRIETAKGCIG